MSGEAESGSEPLPLQSGVEQGSERVACWYMVEGFRWQFGNDWDMGSCARADEGNSTIAELRALLCTAYRNSCSMTLLSTSQASQLTALHCLWNALCT